LTGRPASLKELLESGVSFHGHLGPHLVLGLRMGREAVHRLKPKQLHEMSVTVWTGNFPPRSCVVDGIQVSSGCTFGKRNITVKKSNITKARFRKGHRTITIAPTEKAVSILSKASSHSEIRENALTLYRMPNRELLKIT
jgi:formylmethanofuran dehydrogenase subunit E